MDQASKKEIELKFLLREDGVDYFTQHFLSLYPSIDALKSDVLSNGNIIEQGYLNLKEGTELAKRAGFGFSFEPEEIRLRDKGSRMYMTVKSKGTLVREEENIDVTAEVFNEFWPLTEGMRIQKTRLKVPYVGNSAEFDVYKGRDLITVEVEVTSVEGALLVRPLGKDVTEDKNYKNINLAR